MVNGEAGALLRGWVLQIVEYWKGQNNSVQPRDSVPGTGINILTLSPRARPETEKENNPS